MNKFKEFFKYDEGIFFEIILVLIATALFYIFDKKLNLEIWYLILLGILIVILGSFGIKYLRDKK